MIIEAGGVPIRSGQYRRTMSWLPQIPPVVMMTACADSSNSPTSSRLDGVARSASSGANTVPLIPVATPSVMTNSSTRCRW